MWSSHPLLRLRDTRFAAVPAGYRRRIYGHDWLHLADDAGDVWLTPFAWPWLESVLPSRWFDGALYQRVGQRLPDSTGTVYRVPVEGGRFDLVVKFNRCGQDPLMHLNASKEGHHGNEPTWHAEFLDPFQEAAFAMELAAGSHAQPHAPHLHAQWPLAVFSPSTRYAQWQTGRSGSVFDRAALRLAQDQDQAGIAEDRRTDLDEERDYIIVYRWLQGENADECHRRGLLGDAEHHDLQQRLVSDLDGQGFRVLDMKRTHGILRPRRDGSLLRYRDGRLICGLVDFELMQRTSLRR